MARSNVWTLLLHDTMIFLFNVGGLVTLVETQGDIYCNYKSDTWPRSMEACLNAGGTLLTSSTISLEDLVVREDVWIGTIIINKTNTINFSQELPNIANFSWWTLTTNLTCGYIKAYTNRLYFVSCNMIKKSLCRFISEKPKAGFTSVFDVDHTNRPNKGTSLSANRLSKSTLSKHNPENQPRTITDTNSTSSPVGIDGSYSKTIPVTKAVGCSVAVILLILIVTLVIILRKRRKSCGCSITTKEKNKNIDQNQRNVFSKNVQLENISKLQLPLKTNKVQAGSKRNNAYIIMDRNFQAADVTAHTNGVGVDEGVLPNDHFYEEVEDDYQNVTDSNVIKETETNKIYEKYGNENEIR